ncbi:MAG: clostripain-related cysteine peptidase [Roseiflexus sp.]|nr:clostripain-related cysteine peptidase [Roseiflexus sp.]
MQPAAAKPARKGGLPTWALILALVSVVFVAGCIGALFVTNAITRLGPAESQSGNVTPQSGSAADATPQNGSADATPIRPSTPVAQPAGDRAAWTVLVYLDGDNNLEGDSVVDFNEMELVGSSDKVKIVVQFDRIGAVAPWDDDSNGNWETTKRFLVTRDDDPDAIRSQELADLGEMNMGDPQTLVDFAVWGMQTYPAERYALILWDHGASWVGIAFDETNGEDGINMPELDAALRTIQQQTGRRIDLIGFDACLMGQIDVALVTAPYADVFVASAELEPNTGWPWDLLLRRLVDNPQQNAAAFGTAIVETYREFYESRDDPTVTLAAFDLKRANDLRQKLNALSDAMLAGLGESYTAIAEARSFVDVYSQPAPEEFSAVDLGHFARLVVDRGARPAVAEPARALYEAIDQARIAEWNGGFHANSTGLSIFFPQYAQLYPPIYGQGSPLPQQTSWGDFLKAFHTANAGLRSAARIGSLTVSNTIVSVDNPITVEGVVTGDDIAYVFFFAGIPNNDRSGVLLTSIDFLYPPGSVPGSSIPPWTGGSTRLNVNYNGTQWGLTNGQDTIPVLLGPAKYGTPLYGVEGIYTVKRSNERIAAALVFTVESGTPELIAIYGFPKNQKQEAQPFEIMPVPGDTFTAVIRTYTVKGDRLEPGFVEGDTLTISNQPLAVQRIPMQSGAYVTGFLVRDIAGRFSYQYADINVRNTGASANVPPPVQTSPGTQAGYQLYENPKLGFSIEYPTTWKTLDTGNDQIYFYDPAENGNVFVSVDVYQTGLTPSEANQRLLQFFLESLQTQQNFQQRPGNPVLLGGEVGPSASYQYTDQNGVAFNGFVAVVTSPRTGLSYLVALQAPTADANRHVETLSAIVDSMKIK